MTKQCDSHDRSHKTLDFLITVKCPRQSFKSILNKTKQMVASCRPKALQNASILQYF